MSKKKFKRQDSQEKKLKDTWRRPKGRQSSMRRRKKGKGKMPSPGYGSENRGMHPSGYYEVIVRNVKDLEKIDKEKEAGRISGKVGEKKEAEIREAAEEKDVKILN